LLLFCVLQDSSIQVLQQLLHLAVGDAAAQAATGSSTHPQAPGLPSADDASIQQQQQSGRFKAPAAVWHANCCSSSAAQQQQWAAAAARAVKLFSLQDLLAASKAGMFSDNTWQQLLLLKPQLLDELLEAAAAAVLQPMVAGDRCNTALQDSATGCANTSSNSGSIIALLAGSGLPWQQLPAILAANPLLMLKARTVCKLLQQHQVIHCVKCG
jgi:hypothetical protein